MRSGRHHGPGPDARDRGARRTGRAGRADPDLCREWSDPETEARALFADSEITDDGVSLIVSTQEPAKVLSTLAERNALRGLSVKSATLEDVFLNLTGREYRDEQ